MKVLHIINSMATGGAEKLLYDAVPAFNEKGVTTDIIVLNGNEHPFFTSLQLKKEFTIFSLGKGSVYNPFLIFKIMPYLKKYDIAHVHLFPALYFVVLAKLLSFSKINLLYTEHSTSNNRRKKMLYRFFDGFFYRQYHCIVTISTEVKLLLKKHLGRAKIVFKTINNGVAIASFTNVTPANKELLNIPSTTKVLMQVARFTVQKDQATLIKAIPYMEKPVMLLLVGQGHTLPKMIELVETLDLQDQVKFLGIRTDVAQLLHITDVAVLSSNHEGLSLSSLEAMASGTPLVASNVRGLKNLVHGAGILFQHRDEIDLANKVNRLLDDSNLYQETVFNGLQRVKKYTLNDMVEAHIELYETVCNDKK